VLRARVALVVDVREPLRAHPGIDGGTVDGEQGAPPRHAAAVVAQRRHRGEPARTGAAQELQEERLGLVVAMVRERDVAAAQAGGDVDERGVALPARLRFETGAGGARDGDLRRGERDLPLRAEVVTERAPARCVGRQSVVDVRRVHGVSACRGA